MASTQKTSKAATTSAKHDALESRQIPLASLYLSDDNVRKIPHSSSTIAALASSIATFGLLSDLLVSEAPDGRYAVEAGGGRLAAMQQLAERGTIPADYVVSCKLVPAGYSKQFSTEQAALADEAMQNLQARAAELEAREQELEQMEEEAEEAEDSETAKDAAKQLRELWNEQRGLSAEIRERRVALCVYSAEDKAKAGCVVRASGGGYVEVIRGLVEHRQISADRTPNVQTLGEVPKVEKSETTGSSDEGKRADYSQRLVEDFNAHISGALRNKIATNPKLALALTCLQMMPVGNRSNMVMVSGTPHDDRWYAEKAVGFPSSPAAQEWAQIRQEVPDYETTEGHSSYPRAVEKLQWLLTLEQEQLLALFSALVGCAFDATKRESEEAFLSAVCDAANLDMSDYWNAGKQNFCDAVSRKVLMKALNEAGVSAPIDLERTQKAQAAAVASAALLSTTWLPMPLRV